MIATIAAFAALGTPASSAEPDLMAAAQPAPPPPPAQPSTTYVLYPGHFQLEGANYVWVKGDETLRRTAPRGFIQGQYVWRDRAWVWVPAHYE